MRSSARETAYGTAKMPAARRLISVASVKTPLSTGGCRERAPAIIGGPDVYKSSAGGCQDLPVESSRRADQASLRKFLDVLTRIQVLRFSALDGVGDTRLQFRNMLLYTQSHCTALFEGGLRYKSCVIFFSEEPVG